VAAKQAPRAVTEQEEQRSVGEAQQAEARTGVPQKEKKADGDDIDSHKAKKAKKDVNKAPAGKKQKKFSKVRPI
jgi:hypothetical protein